MNQPATVPPLFTPEELAAQLGVDVDSLRALRENGSGPAYIKIGPRIIRYLGWDVGEWLADSDQNEP